MYFVVFSTFTRLYELHILKDKEGLSKESYTFTMLSHMFVVLNSLL